MKLTHYDHPAREKITRACHSQSPGGDANARVNTFITAAMLVGLAVLMGGCAGAKSPAGNGITDSGNDPFERVNRVVLRANLAIDREALRPAAKTYAKLPGPVRRGVGNFFANLWQPATIVNDVLQGKFAHAGRDSGRFVINTVLGVFGVLDIAAEFGLPNRREDFGQTLAFWGVPPGPYLMLPLLGPSNLRDTIALAPRRRYADPVAYVEPNSAQLAGRGVRLLNSRAQLLGADKTLDLQPDKYLFLRESYRQTRARLIHDGAPPDDELLDELLDESEE